MKVALKQLFSDDNIQKILDFAENKIMEAAKANMPGPDKKDMVVAQVIEFVMKFVKLINWPYIPDWPVDMAIESLLECFVPFLVQKIYDLLKKEKVDI